MQKHNKMPQPDKEKDKAIPHFDFHFHLLFKHAISGGTDVNENIDVKGFADLLDTAFGGPFESQSSPQMVKQSPLKFGLIAILSVEHAFVKRMLRIPGFRLDRALPLDPKMVQKIKASEVSYHELFQEQVQYTLDKMAQFGKDWDMLLLNRSKDKEGPGVWDAIRKRANNNMQDAIRQQQAYAGSRWFALSIEGGHNLSEVPIRNNLGLIHHTPEETLKRLQDREDVDFMAINISHLSRIPEMPLCGFAQGLNKSAQNAFHSPDFHPSTENGLTLLGKKLIKQALTHPTKPILIDVKHMSLYSRLHYYRYRARLAEDHEQVSKLPVISSHTGFTFTTYSQFIANQQYLPQIDTDNEGLPVTTIAAMERKIGKTDDHVNEDLFGNPWTINLFDEEIEEIYNTNGLIGISLDQRVLGTRKMFLDGKRKSHYEPEHLAREEYTRLFENGQLPVAESALLESQHKVVPLPRERHSMLLALHLVHAVRVGLNAGIAGPDDVDDPSPWDYLCIGSDFDGLINPINSVKNVTQLDRLKGELMRYLPQADKTLPFYEREKALRYDRNGTVDRAYMESVIDKVLSINGIRLLMRFNNNWGI
jgi:microsomal dipeptidase-like Zn-dependent dipeptidase